MRNSWLLTAVTVALSGAMFHGAFGQEVSSDRIQQSVNVLTGAARRMDERMHVIEEMKAAVAGELQGKYAAWQGASNRLERDRLEGDLELLLARDLQLERERVDEQQRYVATILPHLRDLDRDIRQAARAGLDNQEAFLEYRDGMGKMFQAIAGTITGAGAFSSDMSPEGRRALTAVEAITTVMLKELAQSGAKGFGGVSLEEQIRRLDGLNGELAVVARMLEKERVFTEAEIWKRILQKVGVLSSGRGDIIDDGVMKVMSGIDERSEMRRRVAEGDGQVESREPAAKGGAGRLIRDAARGVFPWTK